MTDSVEPLDAWRAHARQMAAGDDYAHFFAARFDALAAAGQDVHGEAAFVATLVEPGSRVLDAGCGTGRVATRLAELGYDVAGVDVDEAMIAVARERAPHLTWTVSGLADVDLGETFDVVVLAGNVIPFVDVTTLDQVGERLAAHTAPGGMVVAGFGFDSAHLPPGAPVVPLAAYDDALARAGLRLAERFSSWTRDPFSGDQDGYAVSVHRR